MFDRTSLRLRLVVFLIIFALVPAAIGGIASVYTNVNSAKRNMGHENLAIAKQISSEIKRLLDDSQGLLEAIAGTPTAQNMDGATMFDMIIATQQKNPHFELIFAMDTTGMQIARSSGTLANRGDRPYFKEALKGNTFFTDTYISAFTNAPTVTISTPIKNKSGVIIGVLAADISLKAINEIAQRTHIGQAGYIDVVDAKGTVIAHPDNEKVVKKESFAGLDYVAKAISGQEGTVDANSSRGEKTITAFASVNKYQWGVVAYQPISEAYQTALTTAIILCLVLVASIIAAASAAYFIARSITKPIEELVRVSSLVAEGDLTQNIRVSGVKEVTNLAHAFQAMTESLRRLINQTKDISKEVADASGQLATAAGEVGKASEEVAITIQHVAEGANAQVNLASQSSQAITDMVKATAETTNAAKAVALASEQSERAATEGTDRINQAVTRIEQIKSEVNQASSLIHTLGQKSMQIGQIVDVITDIAGQTNLLALNAAIEAARAGEQGRGFAVVADEVRKLAEQSQTAAKEIAVIIGSIQQETAAVVQAMDKSSQEVASGVHVVQASGQAFRDIFDAVKKMHSQVERIVELASQQQNASGHANQAVHSIADAARSNAAGAEEVAAASEEQHAAVEEIAASTNHLAKLAKDLHDAVVKFKV